MPDDRVLERIGSWQAAGLIDAATADRLRTAEAQAVGGATVPGAGFPSAIGSTFGPTPTIGELFAFLGAGFVLVAWHVLVASWRPQQYFAESGNIPTDWTRIGLEWGVPVLVFGVAGSLLGRRDARARRAAGVAFGVATAHVYLGLGQAFQFDPNYRAPQVVATAGAAIAAFLFRLRLPALLPQLSLLVALAGLAMAGQNWLAPKVFGEGEFGELGGDPLARGIATAAWWLLWALLFGLLARREGARDSARDATPSALDHDAVSRRVNLTRFAAGLTAVGGTAAAVAVLTSGGETAVLPTWAGDLAILAVSGFLFWLAARVSSVYLYPGALGVIIALTSLNTVYVAEQTGIGMAFLVEGGILLLAGLSADRLRRRLAAQRPQAAPAG